MMSKGDDVKSIFTIFFKGNYQVMSRWLIFLVIIGWVSLFISSCTPNQTVSFAQSSTQTVTETSTITPSRIVSTLTTTSTPTVIYSPTSTHTPIPTKTPHENPGLIVTLGEPVDRQGFWPAIPAFSPDGRMIALASERVRLWNVNSHELIHEFERPYSACYTSNATFSTDSSLFAVSISCLSVPDPTGHLLIWDTTSGDLLHDWEQKFADTSKLSDIARFYDANGIAFLPNSSLLAFSNGNTIEIRDIQDEEESVILDLGEEMVATDISISQDGNLLFAFMDFNYEKTHGDIANKYVVQIWNLETNQLQQKINLLDTTECCSTFATHFDEEMSLLGKFITYIDFVNGIFEVTNLENGETKNLPYRKGDAFLSPDFNYIIFLPERDGINCNHQRFELWNVRTGQNIYTFQISEADFGIEWCHAPKDIALSSDNSIIAIAHEERVSLWDISAVVKSQDNISP